MVFFLAEQLAINELIGNGHKAVALACEHLVLKLVNTERFFLCDNPNLLKNYQFSLKLSFMERQNYYYFLEHEMKMQWVRIEGNMGAGVFAWVAEVQAYNII